MTKCLDAITRRVLGIESYLKRVEPRCETARHRWRGLASVPFLSAEARGDEVLRRRRLDTELDAEAIAELGRELRSLPTLERVVRRLDADQILGDADLFSLKRFFYHGLAVLESADGVDGLPTSDSATAKLLREAMETIHPGQTPSTRFHLADELDPTLQSRRSRLRNIRRRLRVKRKEFESQIVDDLGGKFDVHGRYRPDDDAKIDDPRLRWEQGFYRLDNEEIATFTEQQREVADEVAVLEKQQRRRLSNFAEEILESLLALEARLVAFDLRIAAVELRRQIDGCWPREIGDNEGFWLKLNAGRDPTLISAPEIEQIQPIDVTLTKPGNVVIGPNMGGKSALLRLIGLCQWCAQMALPAPARECAISDTQRIVYVGSEEPGRSVESADLSAFGREIQRFVQFWEGDEKISWLLDEPGRGTHPEEGARLAEEIACARIDRGDTVIMATHFPQLARCHGFARLRVKGLDVDDATLASAIAEADERHEPLRDVLRRFMDYGVVDNPDAEVPRDARRVAAALGLSPRCEDDLGQ